MKKVYQNHLRKMLIAIYQPVITRIELLPLHPNVAEKA